MIVDFGVQNYRSIRDLQVLAMNTAKIVSRNKTLDESNIIPFSPKLSLLKTKALYGANSSGKSTMIRALSVFVNIIVNSVKDERVLQKNIDCFGLSAETRFQPTYFQLSFIYKNVQYRYGFEATIDEIKTEWLFGTPGKKEVPFFTREDNTIHVNENQFLEGAKVIDLYKQSNNDIARKNTLFLTVVRSINQGLARELIEYISGFIIISGLSDYQMHLIAEERLGHEPTRKKIAEFLKLADTGIDNILREEIPSDSGPPERKFYTITQHIQTDQDGGTHLVNFFMQTGESQGTQKLFEISPAIIQALEQDRALVIDEFDARLHPLISKRIVELFNSSSNSKSQLIFATHDTNLLTPDLLRRDQITFVEKDKYGASHYYSLADFKGVRNDASFEKDYIMGKYGAIPFLGNLHSILDH